MEKIMIMMMIMMMINVIMMLASSAGDNLMRRGKGARTLTMRYPGSHISHDNNNNNNASGLPSTRGNFNLNNKRQDDCRAPPPTSQAVFDTDYVLPLAASAV